MFIRLGALGLGAAVAPPWFGTVTALGATGPILSADRKSFADLALDAARTAGARYADVHLCRLRRQFIFARDDKIQAIVSSESHGIGIRVIAEDTWGFAATDQVGRDDVAKAAREAVAIARANAKLRGEPVVLAPVKGVGEVSWSTPIEKNAFAVPLPEKTGLLVAAARAALDNGATFVEAAVFFGNDQKYFASTDGSYIDQDIHRIYPNFGATLVDKKTGAFRRRDSLSTPMGMGYEYLDGRPAGKVAGIVTRYGRHYDMLEDATTAGKQLAEILAAKPVEPGKYDLVIDPSNLWLTIHESVGHPLELDRVLGYEANFAGTSFATLDKWKSGTYRYGSEIVNLVADKTQSDSLAAVGYDDEGVKTRQWDLVRGGILVGYQATRDQLHVLGETTPQGCAFADSWASMPMQRMPNVSLQSGAGELSVDELIRDVKRGIYVIGDNSWSIDQQRYNFQFTGQLFYEIAGGKITGMLRDVAYQSSSPDFWRSCVRICDRRDYRIGGSFFDGKGEPVQVSPVSHGCSTARFNEITVINTGRQAQA